MNLQERDIGDFRIYAGAIDGPRGGYTAAVEVHEIRGPGQAPRRVFSSDRLSGGHRFTGPEEALKHAMGIGRQAIRLDQGTLTR
ncbi:hypothetical protein [Methylibium sp.]|uniref:hypothetical protein n=1 Tax=Methylibium sp. TaxID=2067992 RepID=UPI0018428056|nr:hypothetical protein [Methylibium sp.]MBA3590100.1 hypothetical protein [Methylibium sp.]